MPKKKKKGVKGGKKDKDKKVRKSRHLNEKETLSYEQEILDNNRQIARLKSRNQELENHIEIIKGKLQQLEEDRSDVIAHLKRNLQQKIEEAQELNERLYALEELRKEENIVYNKKEEEMEEKYRTMENNLTTEIQLSAGKLSALEEWRVARNDLIKKFELQEKQIKEQEKRHKEQLYEVERGLIISNAKLQKEMEERLNQLSKNFRDTTNLRIADTTKRVIHENIAMNKELDIMFKVCRHLNLKMSEYKQRDYNLKIQASVHQTEAKNALKKVIKQNQLIKQLAEGHQDIRIIQGEMKILEQNAKFNENLAREYENKYQKSEKKIKILEKYIEQAKENKRLILEDIESNKKDILKLKEVIKRAKECIKTILKLQPENFTSENLVEKEKFLRTMLDILGSDMHFQTNTNMQKEEIIKKYLHGSLGLVCSDAHDKIKIKKEIDGQIKIEDEVSENVCKNKCSSLGEDNEELKTSDYFPFDSDSSDISSLFEECAHPKQDKKT